LDLILNISIFSGANMKIYLPGALVLCLLASSPASAEKVYTVACNEKNEPACFEDTKGNIVGVNVDIVRELFKRLKLSLDIQLVPWNRLLSLVEHGKVDAGMPLFKTPERLKYALYPSTPLHNVAMQAYTHSDSDFTYTHLPEDFYGKTVGIRRGYSISPTFDQAVAKGHISINEVDSVNQLIRMLRSNRIDVGIDKGATINFYLKKEGVLLNHIGQVSQPQSAFLVISKSSSKNVKSLFHQVDTMLRTMENEGIIRKITNRFIRQFKSAESSPSAAKAP